MGNVEETYTEIKMREKIEDFEFSGRCVKLELEKIPLATSLHVIAVKTNLYK